MKRIVCVFLLASLIVPFLRAQEKNNARRPMTFMDVIQMRSLSPPVVSPNAKWVLYTLSTPDWKAGKSYTDIYFASLDGGVESIRQMTFTKDKNESSPQWSRDSKFFAFASNREAPEGKSINQIYMMRPDGGEAQKISDAKDGVGSFAFSKDGRWFAFTAGKEDERQLWSIAVSDLGKEKPKQLTKRKSPITSWQFSPDSKQIIFIAPDSVDSANKERKDKKFDVKIRNENSSVSHLWTFDLTTNKETRLTSGSDYSVMDFTISKDSKWVGFHGIPNNRYLRTITESTDYTDLYLLELATNAIERLTNNGDIAESPLSFSPDNTTIAFSAADDFGYFRNARVYIRLLAAKGGPWKKIGGEFDGDVTVGFWSEDGKSIYFNEGWKATNQLFAVFTASGKVTQVTNMNASLSVSKDEDNGVILASYSDPRTPSNYYYVPKLERVSQRPTWRPITNSNPQSDSIFVGETESVAWKSSDGKTVEGILVKPLNFEKGMRYPLVVQIHGGPAGVVVLSYNAGYGYYSNVFAANGYMCLLPNYRGSTNYGEKHKMEIGGDYFQKGYDDIMTGVDYLIGLGLVDSTRMGVMGWSAGGHWSNWILTHTNRFKAVSSGAGAVNWTSMYAESDIQRNREFYFGGKPYDHFDQYWDVSPLKYIKNAKTPTLIHVVDGDPRVPRPQSEELYMALRQLGVPTEFFVYPGTTHGIPDMRNQMVKMLAEFHWMEKWVRGDGIWFDWNDLLDTLKEEKEEKKDTSE